MNNSIIIKMYPIIHKFFKLINKTKYFDNGYGIKAFNKKKINICSEYIIKEEYLNPEELYLGYDGLKDQYSLIDTKMIDSPHFKLMKSIESNEIDFNNEEYVIREKFGYLDGRYQIPITKNLKEIHINKYYENKNKLLNDSFEPINVYELDGKTYIIDGKHRASIACLLRNKVKCNFVDVRMLRKDQYTVELYKELMKNKNQYIKNIKHLELIINEGEE